ncbi:hypothetical protein [Polaromonas sp.]|uniref:hypothetical protein n=1 Tax=Polaromonas sp. TaxID=1869339 RepID=UPI003752D0D5
MEDQQPTMTREDAPTETEGVAATLKQLKVANDASEVFPGEHWLGLGVGLAAWGLNPPPPIYLTNQAAK